MINILFVFILITAGFLFINSVYNLITAPRFSTNQIKSGTEEKFISVLIPARNEENNIGACLDSLLAQNYGNYEIRVLNDQSEDRTSDIINGYTASNSRVKLLEGKPLPEGWLGKNWACRQLAEEGNGEYYLFIDADVTLHPDTLKLANDFIQNKKLDMLSVFPTQQFSGFGDRFVVPLMNWLLLAFLPLIFVYLSRNKSFIAANGQFICISKDAYRRAGGHEALKNKVVEDMELAREVKSSGGIVMTALGYDMIFCRMYSSFADSFRGFSKNFYPGFNLSPAAFIFMLLFFETVFLLPLVLVFFKPAFIWVILMIIFIRASIAYLSKADIISDVLLHPFQMIVLFAVGLNSIYFTKMKRNVWKGRSF